MPTNPYTIVDAINQVTELVTEYPWGLSVAPSAIITCAAVGASQTGVATPDSGSVYSRAEQFLDRARYQVLALGWPENTEMSKPFTISSTKVDLSNVFSVKASGPDAYRDIVIRWDTATTAGYKAYDANARTFVFSGTTLYLDAVVSLTWQDLPIKLADLVISRAKLMFQRRLGKNDQLTDLQLTQELGVADESADRNKFDKVNLPPNLDKMSNPANQNRQQG